MSDATSTQEWRPVAVRKIGAGDQYGIALPPEVGAWLKGRRFLFSIDENGLHYTPFRDSPSPVVQPEGLPEWAR